MAEILAHSSQEEISPVYNSGNKHYSAVFIDVVLIAIIIACIVGNLLVCVAVCFHHNLRKPSNVFIASLATADLLVAILVMPFSLSTDIVLKSIFSPTFCKAWVSFDLTFSSTSLLHLCVISIDRYVHIKKPFKYKRWMTNQKAVVVSVSVWIFKFLTSFVPAYAGDHIMSLSNITNERSEQGWRLAGVVSCNHDFNSTYMVIISIADFYIPCGITIFIYSQIFHLIRKRSKNIRRGSLTAGLKKNKTAQADFRINNQNRSNRKAAIVLGTIIGLFLICWTPFFIDLVVCSLHGYRSFTSTRAEVLTWLGYVNSCMNPCVYAISNPEFRRSFKDLLFRKSKPWKPSRISLRHRGNVGLQVSRPNAAETQC